MDPAPPEATPRPPDGSPWAAAGPPQGSPRIRWFVASACAVVACTALLAVTAHIGFRSSQPPPPPPLPRFVAVDWPKPLTRDLPPPASEATAESNGPAPVDTPTPTPPPGPTPNEPRPGEPRQQTTRGDAAAAPSPPPGAPAPPPRETLIPTPPAAKPGYVPAPLSAGARVELACNREVYAATEVAAFRVEEERLGRTPEEWNEEVKARLIGPTSEALGKAGHHDLAKIARITLEADWAGATGWLDMMRPPLAIRVLGVPAGTEVEISMGIGMPSLHALVMGPHGTVTRRVLLDAATPGVIQLPAPDCWQVAVDPAWNREFLGNLQRRIDVDLAIDVGFPSDGSQEPTLWHRMSVYPPSDVQIRYPAFIAACAHFDPGHPFLDRMASAIIQGDHARRMGLRLGAMRDWREAYAWFRAFHQLRIRYESSAMASPRKRQDDPIQRIRPIHRSLRERAANCADMSILMASALSRSIDTFVMLPPGHAFVAFHDPSLGRLVGLEVTLIGSDEDAGAAGTAAQASGMLNAGTPFRSFRDSLPPQEVGTFDLFLMAMMAGTRQLDEGIARAQAGNALETLESRRLELEASAASAADPSAAGALREQATQLAIEASWGHLRPIYLPAVAQIGAEHAQPDAATLKQHEVRLVP